MHVDIVPHPCVDLVADFSDIPLPDASCIALHLGDVIEHVPTWRLDQVLREWNRLCKVNAVVTGATPNPSYNLRALAEGKVTMHDFLGAIYGAAAWGYGQYEVHYMTYGKAELTALFARYGFTIEDFSDSPGPAEDPWWWVFRGFKAHDL